VKKGDSEEDGRPDSSPPRPGSDPAARSGCRAGRGAAIIGPLHCHPRDVTGDEDLTIRAVSRAPSPSSRQSVCRSGGKVDASIHARTVTVDGEVKVTSGARSRSFFADRPGPGNIQSPRLPSRMGLARGWMTWKPRPRSGLNLPGTRPPSARDAGQTWRGRCGRRLPRRDRYGSMEPRSPRSRRRRGGPSRRGALRDHPGCGQRWPPLGRPGCRILDFGPLLPANLTFLSRFASHVGIADLSGRRRLASASRGGEPVGRPSRGRSILVLAGISLSHIRPDGGAGPSSAG